jgi:hypothetical protein
MNHITGQVAVRTFTNRIVYSSERSCLNCTRQTECWGPGPVNPLFPASFSLRGSWFPENVEPYLKSVFGGICGNFIHPDRQINDSMQMTELNRINAAISKDWDK